MIKRFSKGFYTLALVTTDDNGDPFTFCVNVWFLERRQKNIIYFKSSEFSYCVDLNTKKVICSDFETFKSTTYYLTNIVKGYLF